MSKEMNGWLNPDLVEPKKPDGEYSDDVLTYSHEFGFCVGYLQDDEWWTDKGERMHPLLWMPIPELPKRKEVAV